LSTGKRKRKPAVPSCLRSPRRQTPAKKKRGGKGKKKRGEEKSQNRKANAVLRSFWGAEARKEKRRSWHHRVHEHSKESRPLPFRPKGFKKGKKRETGPSLKTFKRGTGELSPVFRGSRKRERR